jgi:hypothetical protein
MTKCSQQQERRNHRRYLLDLPLDYHTPGSPEPYGGIAINGSERGLFIYSQQNMVLGMPLSLWIFFADEFELAHIEATAKIVRRVVSGNGGRGYGYGLFLTRINEESLRKFRRLLKGSALADVERTSSSAHGRPFLATVEHRLHQKRAMSLLDIFKLSIR